MSHDDECPCCGAYGQLDRGCCDGTCHCHRGVPSDRPGHADLNGFLICRSCDADARGEYFTRTDVYGPDGMKVGFVDTPVPRGRVREAS